MKFITNTTNAILPGAWTVLSLNPLHTEQGFYIPVDTAITNKEIL